jgi:integrase
MKIPTVVVYVRHSADCDHKDEGEDFRDCNCRKQVRWWKNGKLHRRSAKTRSWAKAEKLQRQIEAQFRGDPTVQTGLTSDSAKTIQQAIDLFIKDKQSSNTGEKTVGKYKRELQVLQSFFAKQSLFHVSDLKQEALIEFKATWSDRYKSTLTQQKVQERLRAFLRFCHELDWLPKLPKLKTIQVDEAPTLPLEDDEYTHLLNCISDDGLFTPDRAKKVHALVQLMRHTGLAVRDAVTLERSQILEDKGKKIYRIQTSRQKTGVHVSVPLPHDVAKELLEVLNGNPRYVFWNRGAFGGHTSDKRGTSGREETVVTSYQTDMRELFKKAGLHSADQHMVSHRLRDTFAVGLLKRGIPMEFVAKALGNSLDVCERHYAPWNKARQDGLDTLIMGTWA